MQRQQTRRDRILKRSATTSDGTPSCNTSSSSSSSSYFSHRQQQHLSIATTININTDGSSIVAVDTSVKLKGGSNASTPSPAPLSLLRTGENNVDNANGGESSSGLEKTPSSTVGRQSLLQSRSLNAVNRADDKKDMMREAVIRFLRESDAKHVGDRSYVGENTPTIRKTLKRKGFTFAKPVLNKLLHEMKDERELLATSVSNYTMWSLADSIAASYVSTMLSDTVASRGGGGGDSDSQNCDENFYFCTGPTVSSPAPPPPVKKSSPSSAKRELTLDDVIQLFVQLHGSYAYSLQNVQQCFDKNTTNDGMEREKRYLEAAKLHSLLTSEVRAKLDARHFSFTRSQVEAFLNLLLSRGMLNYDNYKSNNFKTWMLAMPL